MTTEKTELLNKDRYDELAGQLGAVSVEIAKVTSKLGTASPEHVQPLIEKLGKLEDQKKTLLTVLTAMREAERAQAKAEEKAAEVAERKRKDTIFQKFVAKLPPCECGAGSRLNPDFHQPIGYNPGFWEDATARFWVELECTRPVGDCGCRWRVYLDERTKKEKANLSQ
jgi:hypothetical protein